MRARASLPSAPYETPERVSGSGDNLTVRVYPEGGGAPVEFQFGSLPVGESLRETLAIGFAHATGPGGTRRTAISAQSLFNHVRVQCNTWGALPRPPQHAEELRAAHIAALRLSGHKHQAQTVYSLRLILRGNEALDEKFRSALFAPLGKVMEAQEVRAYSRAEMRQIRHAAQDQVRTALLRVRAAEAALAAWARHHPGSTRSHWPTDDPGALLAIAAQHGDMPRNRKGHLARSGLHQSMEALFPTVDEMAGAAILLMCVTGHNCGVALSLTTDYARADDQNAETPVALARARKPRRGPSRSELDLALTASTPLSETSGEIDLSSAYGILRAAEELGARARGFAGTDLLFCGYSDRQKPATFGRLGFRPINVDIVETWRGWHPPSGPRRVNTMRIRRAFLDRHQRPVDNTPKTLADTYLRRDHAALASSQRLVASVLDSEVSRLQATHSVMSLTDKDLIEAATDPEAVATRCGVTVPVLRELLGGRLDTVAAACVDNTHGPASPAGAPCRASFLLCLGCPNARSEPRHAPVQALLLQRLDDERKLLEPEKWERRFATAHERLGDLISRQHIDVEAAAQHATPQQTAAVDALVTGRLELR